MKVTKELNKPWCVSVFSDNSGVIRFDEENNVCFKVETHNHPVGIGAVWRREIPESGELSDPMGTGLGAKAVFKHGCFLFCSAGLSFFQLPRALCILNG